jgi:hypothetical protein
MKKIRRAYETNKDKLFTSVTPDDYLYWFTTSSQGIPPIGLHYSMFNMCIANFCNEEQKKKWMPLVRDLKILGTYA